MSPWSAMVARADQRIASAHDDLKAGRYDTGYESARAAAELGAKAILLSRTGAYPTKDHNVAGHLVQAKVTIPSVSAKELSHLLSDYTRGDYGFEEPVEPRELKKALGIASAVLAHARTVGAPK